MKTLIKLLLIQLIISSLAYANTGHRLGGDIYKPENTLHSFKLAIDKLQDRSDFRYAELDIVESKDNKAIVFHDSYRISRMVPKSDINLLILRRALKKKTFEKIKISDLYEKEITSLVLENGARIPTLKEVLDAAVEWKFKKRMLIEIKFLHSDKCRTDVINLVSQYKNLLNLNFFASEDNYNRSFPDKLRWAKQFKAFDFHVYTSGKPKVSAHDMTRGLEKKFKAWEFSTVLEQSIYIKNNATRSIKIPFNFNKKAGVRYGLRVGIYNGSDNTGDRGLFFKLASKNKDAYLSGFSKEKRWDWYQVLDVESNEWVITLEDLDTQFTGKYPGNGGSVKVNLIEYSTESLTEH